nr:EpsG family protein [Sphingomonas yunnanensis]
MNWVQRFPYTFPDLRNYRQGFESGWYLSSVMNLGWVRLILSEGLWVYGFDALWRWTGNVDRSFFIVTALATFLIVYYIFYRTQSLIAALFVCNPAYVNSVVEQLRSGLATGIFLNATLIRNPVIQVPLFVCAIGIHTSFLLFVLFYYAYVAVTRVGIRKLLDERLWLGIVAVLLLAFIIAYVRDFALTAVGDSRAFIQEDQTSGILLGIAWSLFIASFYLFRKQEEYSFDLYFFMLNVFMFLSSTYMGVYGARFVAIGIPSLAALTVHLRSDRRYLFYVHYFTFSAFYFLVWISV